MNSAIVWKYFSDDLVAQFIYELGVFSGVLSEIDFSDFDNLDDAVGFFNEDGHVLAREDVKFVLRSDLSSLQANTASCSLTYMEFNSNLPTIELLLHQERNMGVIAFMTTPDFSSKKVVRELNDNYRYYGNVLTAEYLLERYELVQDMSEASIWFDLPGEDDLSGLMVISNNEKFLIRAIEQIEKLGVPVSDRLPDAGWKGLSGVGESAYLGTVLGILENHLK